MPGSYGAVANGDVRVLTRCVVLNRSHSNTGTQAAVGCTPDRNEPSGALVARALDGETVQVERDVVGPDLDHVDIRHTDTQVP
jgi:hypothetical protein